MFTAKSAYAFQINDKNSLFNSTSGGAFIALSDLVLEQGGVVVGAVTEYSGTLLASYPAETYPEIYQMIDDLNEVVSGFVYNYGLIID